MEKIRITLWDKMNVIKMVVSSQFNDTLMMLTATISPPIGSQNDTLLACCQVNLCSFVCLYTVWAGFGFGRMFEVFIQKM